MKNNILFSILIVSLAVISFAFINGCGANPTSGGSSGGTTTYYGTQSGGDVWKWVIGSGTFTGENVTTGMTVSGTFTSLPSGFKKATVTSSSGTGAPPNGTEAYFLEFPNTMLLVKPTDSSSSEDKVIVCAAAASSAPPAGVFNYIVIPRQGWNFSSDGAYGTAEAISGTTYTFEVTEYRLGGSFSHSTSESGYTFSNGIFSKTGSSFEVFMTPTEVFVGDNGPGQGGVAGAGDDSQFDTISKSTEVAGKTFRGVLFKYDSSTDTGEVEPIGATGEADGTIRGASFTSVDTSAEPDYTNSVYLQFSTIDNGLATGSLSEEGDTLGFALVVSHIGSTNKIMVFGISTQETSANPYNFLVIEQ